MTWTRARLDMWCGSCRRTVRAGEMLLLVTDVGLRRCGDCATAHGYGAAPADWTPVAAAADGRMARPGPVVTRETRPEMRITDWKRRAAQADA